MSLGHWNVHKTSASLRNIDLFISQLASTRISHIGRGHWIKVTSPFPHRLGPFLVCCVADWLKGRGSWGLRRPRRPAAGMRGGGGDECRGDQCALGARWALGVWLDLCVRCFFWAGPEGCWGSRRDVVEEDCCWRCKAVLAHRSACCTTCPYSWKTWSISMIVWMLIMTWNEMSIHIQRKDWAY